MYGKNVDAAQTRLTSEEAVLTSMTRIMQRITELTVQGGNDTLAAEDRAVIGAEVKPCVTSYSILQIHKTLMATTFSLAIKCRQPAFLENSSGVVSYNGDYGRFR